jgi:hypothetical protein
MVASYSIDSQKKTSFEHEIYNVLDHTGSSEEIKVVKEYFLKRIKEIDRIHNV